VKFKTDENLALEAASILRESGFPCETVWDEGLSGAADQTIAARIQEEGPLLVTLDLEFSNIQAYPPDQYIGIIVLRPKTQDKATVIAYIHKLITLLRERTPAGELWIVQRDRIRVRQAD
jgi:predicted nuclease of predicted toxin-antitoxin system